MLRLILMHTMTQIRTNANLGTPFPARASTQAGQGTHAPEVPSQGKAQVVGDGEELRTLLVQGLLLWGVVGVGGQACEEALLAGGREGVAPHSRVPQPLIERPQA